MKRFIVFTFEEFYPSGGMYDVDDSFDTKEEAFAFTKSKDRSYIQIFDCEERIVIYDK